MKKLFSIFIIMLLVFCGGCSTNKIQIEKNIWNFSRISENETDSVIFCSEENKLKFSDAKVTDIKLAADKNTFTVTNIETQESWLLEYNKNETAKTNNTDGLIYDVYYKGDDKTLKGYAYTGIVDKSFDNPDYYLVIAIGGHSLYFLTGTEAPSM